MNLIWNSPEAQELLRELESGVRPLAPTARTHDFAEWEKGLIAKSLAARRKSPALRRRVSADDWLRDTSQELHLLKRRAEEREFALRHFDPAGFVGNRSHLDRLLSSISAPDENNDWNRWRRKYPNISPNLRGARLTGLDLRFLNLNRIRLQGGDLSGSQLRDCNLAGANLEGVHMRHADLSYSSLRHAILKNAIIEASLLVNANLSDADLRGAIMIECLLNRANLKRVKLSNAIIWGIGAWDLENTDNAKHKCQVVVGGNFNPDDYTVRDLRQKSQRLTVDNIECAHVIELMSNNERIGDILRLASSNLVLLLGRFTGDQKVVLDALQEALPKHKNGYAPIKFDFEQGRDRDLIETITTLASLSRFVIADLTAPASVPLEAQAIVPDIAVPFVPILRGKRAFSMFTSLQRKYLWVLPTVVYRSEKQLIRSLDAKIIQPAERKVTQLVRLKNPRER